MDALWLSPHFPSPNWDCGYDVSDYCDVAPEYGTLDDFKTFLHESHKRGIRVILDLMTVKFLLSYSTRPVQIFGLIGFGVGVPGAAILVWLAYVRLTGQQAIGDRPLLLFGILMFSTGVQLVTLGLLAEMQARTYHESQRKPTYVIREILEEPHRSEGPVRSVRV